VSAALARRLAAWIAGVWAGQVIALGFMAAPSAFAVLARADAGRLVGRLFQIDAYVTLVAGVAVVLLERLAARRDQAPGSAFSTNLILALAAVFCAVAGYFAIEPMMAEARAGRAAVSFAALHGISAAFFFAKALVVAALAWRLTREGGQRATAQPAS
jgi:hypothetical protein